MPLPKERFMTVLGGYTLDMHDHGRLLHATVPTRTTGKDYGTDPVGNGMVRMVPSGNIVTVAESFERLKR